jgi:SAM-dependent methyltransferase
MDADRSADRGPDCSPVPTGSPALVFAEVADAYDRARPGYPREAAAWLTGGSPATVVELGAGTGKLTEELLALGHDVLATDPLDEMLQYLRMRRPEVRTATASAEEIPVASRSVDVVVAAQSFHWFDLDRALPEIARVLKPEGVVALAWNQRDERIPWVRRLGGVLGSPEHLLDPTDVLVGSRLFGYVEEAEFRFWQRLRRDDLRDLVRSRSHVAAMDPMARERVLRRVDELFDSYDRGPDGLLLPYLTRCFRAVVRPRPAVVPGPEEAEKPRSGGQDRPGDEPDDAATLIDFR